MKLFKVILFAAGAAMLLSACGIKSVSVDTSDVYEIIWYCPGDKLPETALVMDEINKITAEKIGVKLDLQFIDAAAYAERVRMNMAAQEKFDICNIRGDAMLYDGVTRSGLIDITDIRTPGLMDAIPHYSWDAMKVDGRVYAVPNVQIFAFSNGLMTSRELIDKTGFDYMGIKTSGDVEAYLAALKSSVPEIIPYRRAPVTLYMDDYYETFTNLRVAFKKDGSNKIMAIQDVPEVYETAKLYRSFYEKGYIRSDAATVTDDTSDYLAGKYGVANIVHKPGVNEEITTQFGKEMVSVPINKPYISRRNIVATALAVSKTSKNIDKVMAFLELVNTDKEIYNLICYGIEGKHYNKIDNDTIEIIESSGYVHSPNAAWKFGNQFNSYLMPGQDPAVWEETIALNDSADCSPLLGFSPNTDTFRTELAQVLAIYAEYDNIMVTGSEEPDVYWKEFCDRMNEAGMQKIVAELQKQVDEYLAG